MRRDTSTISFVELFAAEEEKDGAVEPARVPRQTSEGTLLASRTVYDGLGSDEVREVTVTTLKWRFFALGLRAGIALQMFLFCLGLVLLQSSSNQAIDRHANCHSK